MKVKIKCPYNTMYTYTVSLFFLKDKDQFWSCDYIVKETLGNRSEKVDHLVYKYWCTARFLNDRNDIRLGPVLVKLHALYTERCIWDYTNMWRKNLSRFV